MKALEHLLQGDPEKIQPIFAEGDSTFGGSSLHSTLLWALETLAWEPKHLGRVCLILARLAKIDPGGSLSNRPINSLKEILIAWHPGTSSSLDERLQVIDLILDCEPEIGWTLLSSLMPRSQQISHPTHEPIWRDFGRSQKEPLTRGAVWTSYQQYIDRALSHAGKESFRWKELIDIYPNVSESYQQAIEKGLEELSETELTNDARKDMWETLRRFVSQHREFPDASWALPGARLDRLDKIMALYSPQDHIAQISWLFDEHFPDIPFPKHDLDETKLQIKKLRNEGLEQIWSEGGTPALIGLIDIVMIPGFVAEHLLELTQDEAEILSIFEKTSEGSDNQRVFARCLSKEAYNLLGDRWTNLVISKASKLAWPTDKTVNAFVYYPDSAKTFNLVSFLGGDVERRYWEDRFGHVNTEDSPSLLLAIKKLKSVGRALDVIVLGPKDLSKLDTKEIFELLDQALKELNEEKTSQVTSSIGYSIEELFNWLRSRTDIDRTSLAKREYAYLPLLTGYYRKRKLALHDLLAIDAGFFIEIICDIYKPASGQEESGHPSEQELSRAEFGLKLLDSWNRPPGLSENNQVDGTKLRDWVEQARKLATKKDRIDLADQNIGIILYYYPPDPEDSAWPHIELRKLLEDLQNDQIERGIELEQFNSRGTVSKAVLEGGDQERGLAHEWRNWAATVGSRWPRTRVMLERIAQSWEHDARREDDRAEKRRYRYG